MGEPAAAVAERPLPFAVELGLFALIAAFSMALWARLVEPSSADRQALALLVVAAGAIALQLLARVGSRGGRRTLCIAVAFATMIGALVAAGLPAHLLAPAQWGELRTQIQGGMGGIEQAELPYAGSDPWIRLTLVLGAPALVALAGMIAFWPARRRGPARAAALAVLLIAYGIAATLDNPGAEAFWGIVLLVLAVAWLWAPRLQPGRRAAALAVAFGAGVLALPATAKLNGPAWWDYENWSWFGAQRTVSFEWNHSYGPLDWPREGTTVMSVDTSAPLYWKASVLDRFDGYGWQRALPGDPDAAPEVRARSSVPGGALERKHPGWVADATFELRALSSDVVIGTGLTESIDGLSGTLASGDGTLTPCRRAARARRQVLGRRLRAAADPRSAPRGAGRQLGAPFQRIDPALAAVRGRGDAGARARGADAALGGARPDDDRPGARLAVRHHVPPRPVLDRRCADALRRGPRDSGPPARRLRL